MFWSNAYTRFLEEEIKVLREQNRILVSAMLERSGHREAAQMLRGEIKQEAEAKPEPKPEPEYVGRNWREMAQKLSGATRPKQHTSSGEALEDRVKEVTQ